MGKREIKDERYEMEERKNRERWRMDGAASQTVWLRNMKVKVGRSWAKAGAGCY